MDEFIGEFIVETQEGLTALDTALVTFSAQPNDKDLLDKIFRTLHTIKGTCGFLGLARLEKTAHIAETLLDKFRKEDRHATPDDVNLILSAMDHIRFLVDAIQRDGREPEGDDSRLIASLQAAVDGTAPPPAAQDMATVTESEQMPSASLPAPTGGDGQKDLSAAAPVPEQASQFLRIHVDVLEEMLAMVSELVLTRNQLNQIVRGIRNDVLDTSLQKLDSTVSELQNSVMKARMQPIGNAWAKFPRIIHDIARETGKKIQLDLSGEETEIDRQVLEMIKDPLMHMVRNSADHGIEMPEERRAAGKKETGIVSLSARHERGFVIIDIRDDGKGLSLEKIKKTVVARGIATEEQLAGLPEKHILSYIFAPGFSTAEKVTAISGRGVGMDVVRTNIEKIGGTIDLQSVPGKGTHFSIHIPLTLAIVPTLLVRAGEERYAIPQRAVQELIHVSRKTPEKIETLGDFPVLRLREHILPLVHLDTMLGGSPGRPFPDEGYIVVLYTGSAHYGLIVDSVIGTEEIVVKPLPSAMRGLSLFSGNTILGDGRVIMILDPGGIATQEKLSEREIESPSAFISDEEDTMDRTELLIFRAEDDTPKAVPAFLVTRIAEFKRSDLERNGEKTVVQYQGRLIALHALGALPQGDIIKALIFSDDRMDRMFAVAIEKTEDIVSAVVEIEEIGRRPGYLGSAIINGRATDILDINYFTGEDNWLPADMKNVRDDKKRRILLVDDSVFFRHMLQPMLSLAGYTVMVAPGPVSAMGLYDRGMDFDLIISDIEMEEMDGLSFAEKVKGDTRWKDTPMVALSSRATPQDKEIGYSKGFSAYVSKSDRDALLSTLRDVFEKTNKSEQR